MEPSNFKTSILVESYGEKNCWKLPKLLHCINAYNFKTIKDVYPEFWIEFWIPETWIEDLNKGCVQISRVYLWYFPRNKPSKSVTVGSGRFIDLNDSASPEIVIIVWCLIQFMLTTKTYFDTGIILGKMHCSRHFFIIGVVLK